jgi:hypothetical protein
VTDETIAMITGMFAANGIGYAGFKFLASEYRKYQEKKGIVKYSQFAIKSDCETHHNNLVSLASTKLNEIRDQVTLLHSDIKVMVEQRTFEDGIKRKHDVILANATSFIDEKLVHSFAIRKADRFKDFVLDNYKTMWQSNFETFADKTYALAQSIRKEGDEIAGDYTSYFYSNYHQNSCDRYLADVKDIFEDMVNNKSERFVDCSMMFMQKFLSDMAKAYVKWAIQTSRVEE